MGVATTALLKVRLRHQGFLTLHRSRTVAELDGSLTATGLAQRIGVERSWVYRRLERG
jgi:hypothetical protein